MPIVRAEPVPTRLPHLAPCANDNRFSVIVSADKRHTNRAAEMHAERFVTGSAVTTDYFVDDHLGSPAVIVRMVNNVATVEERDSGACAPARQRRDRGDAWGKMRDPSSWAYDSSCALPPASATTRHFTGHESLANACLINANARLYDPQIGRFLSADPTVDALYNPQDLNRYSYVLDNPLSLTDPTGYGGLFKNPLVGAVAGLAAAALFQYELLPFIEGTTFAALLAATTPAAIAASPAAASGAAALLAVNAGVAGGISGAITTGSLKGAVLGGLEAEAFYQVGSALQSATGSMSYGAQTATTMVAHGMVGGLFSIGQKGGFGSGFLAAGIGAAADTPELETGPVGDIVIQATAGGVGSILGGGKFANGAVTGAFGYLFMSRASSEDDSDSVNQSDNGQPESDQPPGWAKDPGIWSAMKQAWIDSNPDAPSVPADQPGSLKHEQGGWVIKWTWDGYDAIRVAPGTRDSLGTINGTRPNCIFTCSVVGWFHTHPNWNSEGYGYKASPGDIGFTQTEAQVPGVILTHHGLVTIPYP